MIFTGSINYQFGYATGKSATATAATPLLNRDTLNVVTTDLTNVPTRDILLDFDRTHNIVITLGYATGPRWGPDGWNHRRASIAGSTQRAESGRFRRAVVCLTPNTHRSIGGPTRSVSSEAALFQPRSGESR